MRRASRLGVASFAFVGVAVATASVGACGTGDEEALGKQASGLGADGGDADAGACRDVTLVATRTATGAVDASESLVPSMTFTLPPSLAVVDGEHGSHNIDFTYILGGTAVTCRYKGRDGTLPLSVCSNGAVAGQAVTANDVTLAVDHGGPKHSDVRATIELHEVCDDAGSDAGGGGSDGGTSDAATDAADSAPDAESDGSTCSPATCTTSNPCLTATCGPAGCTITAQDGIACNDQNSCTVGDLCQSGTCAGTPVVLPPPSACLITTCDPVLGVLMTPAVDGTPCSIDACTVSAACQSGTCAGGTALDCSSGHACVIDGCDPSLGCTHTPRPAGDPAASDNNACNGLETCNGAGGPQSGTPPVIDDAQLCTIDGCDPATGPTHTPIPNCDPSPVNGGDTPFEPRASVMGRLVTRSGGAVTGATFTVREAPAPDGSGLVRGDVSASVAGDGSFRLRLTSFPDVSTDRTPPIHVVVRVDAAGVLPAFRDVWLRTGTATDLGVIKMIPRDAASTPIGPAGGTASDSANTVQVVIPPGALSSTINVVITPLVARDEFPAPLTDGTATMYGVELEPSGTTFAVPVTVRLANTKNIPTTFSIPTGYYDTELGRWEHLGQATWDGSRFAFTTTHFTTTDGNDGLGGKPGITAGPGPKGGDCKNKCCPEAPLSKVGSRAELVGGGVNQTFALPTYRVRGEDFGVTLGYDSGLAAGRTLGAVPSDYEASPHTSHAVTVRGLRVSALSVPSGFGGTTGRQPGSCAAQPVASLGQSPPISLRADLALGGSTASQSFSMGANYTQADFSGFINLPVQGGQVTDSGLYAAHVVVSAQTSGACVTSGGTFGVTNESSPGTQLPLESGPLATFDYHELVHHRLSSPYGTGWTIEELERVYRAGDTAFLVKGDGSNEQFRPRAYPHYITQPSTAYALTRDPLTGEVFLVRDAGDVQRVDPTTGATTTIVSGLALAAGVRGAAVAYVGGTRHFAVALATGLVDVDAGGAMTTLATRPAAPQFREAKVAARGDLVFYTDGTSGLLYRTRLSDPAHTVEAMSAASGGDVRLFPRAPLSGVTFTDPRGMDFGADGTLYVADVQRNEVYAISPQLNGEVGPASAVAPVVGDGTSNVFAPLGERLPGVKLAVREPLAVTTAEDGTLMIVTAYGVAWYDPLARQAEWLALFASMDEIVISPTENWVAAQALGPNALLVRNSSSDTGLFLARIDIDRLSSELDPTRTLTPVSGGGLELLDTTDAVIEHFDAAGRITQRKHRTGELMMGFSYTDARSDKLDHVTDVAGAETTFAYDGAGKLAKITDARGRITNVTVSELGDLTSFRKPDLETYGFTYAGHRMTRKEAPYGDVTTYSFHPNGTVETLTKPEGQLTTVDAVLAHPPSYDANGKLLRTGSYTDGRGVTHDVETNALGAVEKDTYVADGITRVEQAIYAAPGFIADPNPLSPINDSDGRVLPQAAGTSRRNTLFRVSHKTVNGVATGPERRFWDGHYRPRAELIPTVNGSPHHIWVFGSDGWLRAELAGGSNLGQAYARDGAGHVTQTYDSSDLNPAIPPVSGQIALYTYRPDGQLATKTEHGVLTTFSYDDAGGSLNPLGWIDAVGRSMAYQLDAQGNIAQTFDGVATTYAVYDSHNRVIETRDALGNATTYGYNATSCGCSQDALVTNIHTPDLPAGVGLAHGVRRRRPSRVGDGPALLHGELRLRDDGRAQEAHRQARARHELDARPARPRGLDGRHARAQPRKPLHGAGERRVDGPDADGGQRRRDARRRRASPRRSAQAITRSAKTHIPIMRQPAAITMYRDATFALGFTRIFDQNHRLSARADRSAFAIDSTAMPGFFTTAPFWYQQNVWNINTARPVLAYTQTTNSNDTTRPSSYQQDIYFDDTLADGSGLFQSLESLVRDTAGRVTTLSTPPRRRRPGNLDLHLPPGRPPRPPREPRRHARLHVRLARAHAYAGGERRRHVHVRLRRDGASELAHVSGRACANADL